MELRASLSLSLAESESRPFVYFLGGVSGVRAADAVFAAFAVNTSEAVVASFPIITMSAGRAGCASGAIDAVEAGDAVPAAGIAGVVGLPGRMVLGMIRGDTILEPIQPVQEGVV